MSKTLCTQGEHFRYFYKENLGPYRSFHKSTTAKLNAGRAVSKKFLADLSTQQQDVRILDIGCGGGELTGYLLDSLVNTRPDLHIFYLATDAASVMLDLAKEKLRNAPPNVDLKFKQVGVYPPPDTRLGDTLNGETFDLILASFVMFWIDNWNDTVEQLLECLNPNGVLCVILNCKHPGEEGAKFRNRLFKITRQEMNLPNSFFAEDLEAVLKAKGIDYSTEAIRAKIDLGKGCRDRVTETTEFLLGYPRNKLTIQQVEAIKKEIRNSLEDCNLVIWQKMLWYINQ